MTDQHKPGCEALGGYGHGVGPCDCGATPAPAQPDAAEIWALAQVLPGEGMEDAIERIEVRLRAAPAQPDPLHVANERGEGEEVKDAARYRRFFNAGLPITFMGVEYDDKASLDAAIDADLAQEWKT